LAGLSELVAEMSACQVNKAEWTTPPLMKAGLFRFLMRIVSDPVFLREEETFAPGGWESRAKGRYQERLQAILLVIDEEASSLEGGEDLARRSGISRSELYRLLRKMGLPAPLALIEQVRLDLATRLLLETDRAILEIALETGFASLSSFYRAFRRSFGISPGHWRRQSREMD